MGVIADICNGKNNNSVFPVKCMYGNNGCNGMLDQEDETCGFSLTLQNSSGLNQLYPKSTLFVNLVGHYFFLPACRLDIFLAASRVHYFLGWGGGGEDRI